MDASEISERIQCFLEREFPNEGVALALDTNLLEDWFIDSLGITDEPLLELDRAAARAELTVAEGAQPVGRRGRAGTRFQAAPSSVM